jgi:hypothetical protein
MEKQLISAALVGPHDQADLGPVDLLGADTVEKAVESIHSRALDILGGLDRAFVDVSQDGRI